MVRQGYRVAKRTKRGVAESSALGKAVSYVLENKVKDNNLSRPKTRFRFKKRTMAKPKVGGRKRNAKTTKCKQIQAPSLKGIAPTLKRKVMKIMNSTENWGKYVGCYNLRLRQTVVDAWNIQTGYENSGTGMLAFGTPLEILHIASVLYNSKTDNPDYTILAGNLDDRISIQVQSWDLNFFFKSTSSHVVNIEMYECTGKAIQGGGLPVPTGLVSQSYSNSNYNTVNNFSYGGSPAISNLDATQPGSTAEEWTELYQTWNVVRHTLKLQPGDHVPFVWTKV